MGSERSEEEKAKEAYEREQAEKRIETFKNLIDQAYILFDGKYSVHEIETMPYHELMDKIERERKIIERQKEYREAEKQNNPQWRY